MEETAETDGSRGSPGMPRAAVILLFGLSFSLSCAESAPQPESASSDHTDGPGPAADTLRLEPQPDQRRMDSLFAEAMDVYYGGQYDSARVLLGSMRSEAVRHSLTGPEARAITWLGLAAWRLGAYEEARLLGEEALSLKLEHGIRDQLFRSYNALGLLAWNENRLSEASELFQRAVDAAGETSEQRDAAAASGNLALVHTELGRFDDARAGFTTMMKLAAELNETRTVGNAHTNLGMLEIRVGNPNAAIPHLMQARIQYDSVNYATGVLSALGQLGTAYTALGEPQAAFAALDTALAMARNQGLRQEEASNLEALAELYREAGDFQRALSLYDQARDINEELGLDVETGADLRGEADIRARLGDLYEAHSLAEEAFSIHREAGARLDQLMDLLLLAEIQDLMQAGAALRATLHKARGLVEELDAGIARTELALTEARIADRQGEFSRVLDVTRDASRDLSRGRFSSEWEAYLLRSRAFDGLGQADSALATGRRALAAVERVRSGFGSSMLRTAYLSDRQDVYAHLVSLLLAHGRVSEAFAVSDAARGRALIEGIGAARGRSAFPVGAMDSSREQVGTSRRAPGVTTSALLKGENVLHEIDQLVQSIDYLEGFPQDERTVDQLAELGQLYAHVDSLRNHHEELIVRAAETDPAFAALLGSSPTTAGDIQDALFPGQVLVEFLVPPSDSVLVFALTQTEVHHFRAPIQAQNLASRIRLVRGLITQGPGAEEEARRVLSGLHGALLGGLFSSGLVRADSELLFVPHGVLNYLPFAALYDEEAGRYLAQDHRVRMLPSAGALPALLALLAPRLPAPDASGNASVLVPFPRQLPATLAEADAVSRGMPGIKRYLGESATEARLRQALASPQVVHVATHGVLNANNPMFSRLELAPGEGGDSDDGRFEVHELFRVTVASPLVFLSGCETAAGTLGSTSFARGEDLATLAQAFLYAGARNVVATLWPVEDAGAARFAEAFYRGMENGSPSHALAFAQRSLLGGEEFRAPYYWAAYQLVGDGLEIDIAHRSLAESVKHP